MWFLESMAEMRWIMGDLIYQIQKNQTYTLCCHLPSGQDCSMVPLWNSQFGNAIDKLYIPLKDEHSSQPA